MPVTVPLSRFAGDHPTITGDRQVPSQPGSKAAEPAVQVDRWCRNGLHPDAAFFNQINAAANAGMLFRTKEVFSCGQILGSSAGVGNSSVLAARARWRFAAHTSPYHHAWMCSAVMYPQTTGYNADSYATLKVYSDATETTLVATAEFHYGANPLQSASIAGWQHLREVTAWVEGLSADTTYYCVVSDVNYGNIQSLCVADIQSATEGNDGYLPTNFGTQSQLLDEYRANVLEVIPPLWKRGGAKLFNWTVDLQSSFQSNATTTTKNLIDGTSTTYGASIPGFTLNLTGKARISQSGVKCKMLAYLDSTSAFNGRIRLHNSSGTVIAPCNYLGVANTPHWEDSGTFTLPATSAKYYLTFDQTIAAATVKAYAVTLIEYE